MMRLFGPPLIAAMLVALCASTVHASPIDPSPDEHALVSLERCVDMAIDIVSVVGTVDVAIVIEDRSRVVAIVFVDAAPLHERARPTPSRRDRSSPARYDDTMAIMRSSARRAVLPVDPHLRC
jgi:hypothetical protein